MAYDRIQRINELLREQLAGALYRVGSGEDVDRVAISFFSAEVSRDLRDATVQVSFLGDDPAKHAALLSWLRRHRAPGAQPSAWMRECSRLCYGVYVLHMFFLQGFYYYSPLPAWFCASEAGVWLLPWCALALTMAASALGTWLLLKSRTGRFLIG